MSERIEFDKTCSYCGVVLCGCTGKARAERDKLRAEVERLRKHIELADSTLVEAKHELYAVANALHGREGYTKIESDMRQVETRCANTLTELRSGIMRGPEEHEK